MAYTIHEQEPTEAKRNEAKVKDFMDALLHRSKHEGITAEQLLRVLTPVLYVAQEIGLIKKCCEDFESDIAALKTKVEAHERKLLKQDD